MSRIIFNRFCMFGWKTRKKYNIRCNSVILLNSELIKMITVNNYVIFVDENSSSEGFTNQRNDHLRSKWDVSWK